MYWTRSAPRIGTKLAQYGRRCATNPDESSEPGFTLLRLPKSRIELPPEPRMTSESRTWHTSQEFAEHARLLIALTGARPNAKESTVSAALVTSTRHLQRALVAAGTTFRDERLQARMTRAERLLANSDESLVSVAVRCGYAHAPAFTRAFKGRHDGMTPKEWRRCRPNGPNGRSLPQGEVGVLLVRRFNAVVRAGQ
jgi:AraC-like DNA-binding protein